MKKRTRSQPHKHSAHKPTRHYPQDQAGKEPTLKRIRLPPTRQSITHKFSVAGHEGYLTVGVYTNGKPGELFIKMAKEGSTIGGLMDAFGITVSLALQWGMPLEVLVNKLRFTHFEPSGNTENPALPTARSIIDYIARWLGLMFLPPESSETETLASNHTHTEKQVAANPHPFAHFQADAPPCDECGAITVRNANCYRCFNCGSSQGCS